MSFNTFSLLVRKNFFPFPFSCFFISLSVFFFFIFLISETRVSGVTLWRGIDKPFYIPHDNPQKADLNISKISFFFFFFCQAPFQKYHTINYLHRDQLKKNLISFLLKIIGTIEYVLCCHLGMIELIN